MHFLYDHAVLRLSGRSQTDNAQSFIRVIVNWRQERTVCELVNAGHINDPIPCALLVVSPPLPVGTVEICIQRGQIGVGVCGVVKMVSPRCRGVVGRTSLTVKRIPENPVNVSTPECIREHYGIEPGIWNLTAPKIVSIENGSIRFPPHAVHFNM